MPCRQEIRFGDLAVLLLLALTPEIGACRLPPANARPARNLVIVTIDTLRADRVGIYGNRHAETPRLDRIGGEGAMAPQATAHVPLTRPSHVSLFTGLLPYETGVRDNLSPALDPGTALLAEVLKKAGFATAAFVSAMVLDASSGLSRGFDTYEARLDSGGGLQFLGSVRRKGDVTTREAITWLQLMRQSSGPAPRFFLWLHLYDVHDPYEPPEPYATRYVGRPYDGAVAWVDELVGRLDDALARLELRDQTLLVVTSDHGEGLGEHGETLHGFFTYQTTLQVPFLARGPAIHPGTRLAATVRMVDLFPTVLDMLGVPSPRGVHLAGASLAQALRGDSKGTEPLTYAESLVPLLHFGWSDLRVLREGRWKYIQAPRAELYDLETDPEETNNLVALNPARGEAMRAALGRILDEERRGGVTHEGAAAVPLELLEKLGALGYIGGMAPAKTTTPGADPKDRIEQFRFASEQMRAGLLQFEAKDYPGSAKRFQTLLERGISSFEVHFFLGRALFAAGRIRAAAPQFEEAARWAPASAAAWKGLGESRTAMGDANGALEALHRGEAAVPRDADLRLTEARLLRKLGRGEEARRAYESGLSLAPGNAQGHAELGELLRDLGAVDEAIRRQREAVDLEPSDAYYWATLGMTLGGSGRMDEAEKAFREAWRLDGADHRNAYNLGLALLRQGRAEDARPFFEKALQLAPGFTPARQRLSEMGRPARK
ncbi:MAG TPA: sulfatase-like hydrolase/transferase [Vicinamibacteria bacterium]|jgi:arylsulfatase A-like enzyme/tetratricopeptide (TPR) repeat protein|nr:sulfatase-like hydrolase/transferase [Vicinamibacteria bacterium]